MRETFLFPLKDGRETFIFASNKSKNINLYVSVDLLFTDLTQIPIDYPMI